jgi:acyl-activating enzyme 14
MPPPRHCQGHIAQCLGRILACRGDATVAAAGPGGRLLSGAEFVDGVRSLAAGLVDRGVRPGHVVAAVALNRYLRTVRAGSRSAGAADMLLLCFP